jgi:AraC-like DNA-binding protein
MVWLMVPEHILSGVLPTEQLLFASGTVCLGRFRVDPSDPTFGGGEPCTGHTVVFPRRAVWIQHEGGAPFVADPATVPLYNRGQVYRREVIDARGDACEWMAFPAPVIADALAAAGHPRQDDPDRPFDRVAARSTGSLYSAQRRMFSAAARGASAADLEERALRLLDEVLCQMRRGREEPVTARTREVIEEARRLINLEGDRPHALPDLARACGMSPYRLCREFRRVTGMTISAYRTGLKLFTALEALPESRDLSALALDAGFSSHSHFSAAFRRLFHTTPSALRSHLRL